LNHQLLHDALSSTKLPTPPAIAMRVIELTDDPNVTPRELTDLVQADSGLSSKILRTVNSAFYGLATPVASIKRAQILLGLNAIKTLTLGFSLVQSIRGSGGEADGFDYTTFWRRSLHAATCAKAVATRTGAMEPEEALLGGLLQDVGMVVLHRTLGETYDRVVRDAGGRHRELTRLELLELDLTHAVVGATLAERWRFPSSLITPIRHHEKPTAAPQAQRDAAKCVGLASLGASALTEADSIPELRRYLSSARSWLSLDEREAEAALEEAAAGAREFGKLLDVDAGAPVNTQTILESAKEKLVNLSAGPQVEDAVRRLRDERSLDSITGALSKTGLTERLRGGVGRGRQIHRPSRGRGPPGIGAGLPTPHAKLAGLDRLVAVFARLQTPVSFDSLDDEPVDLVFLLLAPIDAAAEHLKALAQVARIFRDDELCAALRRAANPSVAFDLLTGRREPRAA